MNYTYNNSFIGKAIKKQMRSQGYGEIFEIVEKFYKTENIYRDDYIEPYGTRQVQFVRYIDESGKQGEMSKAVFNSIMEVM